MDKCFICEMCDDNPVLYGTFMSHKKIKVHYYCLLLSTNLMQRGKDHCGILGFLKWDIINEAKNAAKRMCSYCGRTNASIKCASCPKFFHLVCGIKQNCVNEFYNEFKSYCNEHHLIRHSEQHEPERGCFICLKPMGHYNPVTSVMAGCCSKGWIHSICTKKYALSAGYYLKCLWCSSAKFRDEVRTLGIFVPDRDALWEKDKETYAGLHKGYSTCDASLCLCAKGRNFKNNNKWKLFICGACGASGVHLACYRGKIENDTFMCAECKGILHKTLALHEKSLDDRIVTHDRSLYVTKSLIRVQDDIENFSSVKESTSVDNVKEKTIFEIDVEIDSDVSLLSDHDSPKSNPKSSPIPIPSDDEDNELFLAFNLRTLCTVGFVEGKKKVKNHRCLEGIFGESELSITKRTTEEELRETEVDLDEFLLEAVQQVLEEDKQNEIVELSGSESDVSADYLLDKLVEKT